MKGFWAVSAEQFYSVEEKKKEFITLHKADERIMDVLQTSDADVEVVPFRRGQKTWSIT